MPLTSGAYSSFSGMGVRLPRQGTGKPRGTDPDKRMLTGEKRK